MVIDDFTKADLVSTLGARWRGVTDTVMGGISQVALSSVVLDDRRCMRMVGDVSLENNGGFVQASLQLAAAGHAFDASSYGGICLVVKGNEEEYGLHLRTTNLERPWQSYRAQFSAGLEWQQLWVPFDRFRAHRTSTPMDLSKLLRLGVVAIGRAFHADLAVAHIALYD